MRTISISTQLPLSAGRACELAQRVELFLFITRGPMRFSGIPTQFKFETGATFNARMWFFSLIPAWRHHGTVTGYDDDGPVHEIRTTEHGGPVRTWNHTLTFEPTGPASCRYTDTIAIEAGPMTGATVLFARLFFAWRQHRWRLLARVIA